MQFSSSVASFRANLFEQFGMKFFFQIKAFYLVIAAFKSRFRAYQFGIKPTKLMHVSRFSIYLQSNSRELRHLLRSCIQNHLYADNCPMCAIDFLQYRPTLFKTWDQIYPRYNQPCTDYTNMRSNQNYNLNVSGYNLAKLIHSWSCMVKSVGLYMRFFKILKMFSQLTTLLEIKSTILFKSDWLPYRII